MLTRSQEAHKLQIDHNSLIPYYAQVKEKLRERIEQGVWTSGQQIPGEPELCSMFDVSRTVIRQALGEMMHEGLIVRYKGRGTFVAEPKISESLVQKLTGFYQDMADRGFPPISHVLKQLSLVSTPKIAGLLQLVPGAPVIEIERLRFVRDEPIVLVDSFFPYEPCKRLLDADLTSQSLYAFLEEKCDLFIARGRRTIEAVAASGHEAELLQVEKGAPLMQLDSVSYLSDGTPIEYFHALHRGDRSRFETELIRVRKPRDASFIMNEERSVLSQELVQLDR